MHAHEPPIRAHAQGVVGRPEDPGQGSHGPRGLVPPQKVLQIDCVDEVAVMHQETTDRFLVHNGDLIHTIDLKDLLRRHQASGAMATLAGIFRPTHNTLSVGADGRLMGVHGFEGYAPGGNELARLTFAGIAIYEKAFLAFVQPGIADIKPYWTAALKAGHAIKVANYSQDAAWFDFGTPQGLWDASKFQMELTGEY